MEQECDMRVTGVRRRAWRTVLALALSCVLLLPAVHAHPTGNEADGLDLDSVMLEFHRELLKVKKIRNESSNRHPNPTIL